MVAALRLAGAPADVVAAAQGRAAVPAAADLEVWPENAMLVNAFILLETAWTWLAPAFDRPRRIGLPASEIQSTLTLLGVRKRERRQAFLDLRTMERAALDVIWDQA